MPGRSLIKRARRRLYIGAWLVFGIGSAFPGGKPECRLMARSAMLPVLRRGSDCGERIRPRQRHSPGRPCHPAIYGSAQSAKPLPTSGADGLSAPRFVTGEVSQPPQRSQYILSHTAITVNHAFLPRLCHIIGSSFTRETASPRRPRWATADIVDTAPVGCAAVIAGAPQLTVRVWRRWLTWWWPPPAGPISPSGECCAFWMDWLSSATCQPNT